MHRVYPMLEAPEEVGGACDFDIVVGIARAPGVGVSGAAMRIDEECELDVTLDLGELELLELHRRQFALHVRPGVPLPVREIRVRAPATQGAVEIRVFYSILGKQVGTAARTISVTDEGDAPGNLAIGATMGAELERPRGKDVDLAIRVVRRPGTRFFDWSVDSPHACARASWARVPDADRCSEIPDDPETVALSIVHECEAVANAVMARDALRGIGISIAEMMPRALFELVAMVRAHTQVERPTILLLLDPAFVPWELAVVPAPFRHPDLPSHLCAQARISRWLLQRTNSSVRQFPTAEVPFSGADVFASRYGGFQGPAALPSAMREAEMLANVIGARHHEASSLAILERLKTVPGVSVLHFAMHGDFNTHARAGLVTSDGSVITANMIRAQPLSEAAPLVFLNACRVGAAAESFGSPSGAAAAFVQAGAAAVVAPIWSVGDARACDLATGFYERALRDGAVAEFLHDSKLKIADPADASPSFYAAYQLYGHPSLTVQRATS